MTTALKLIEKGKMEGKIKGKMEGKIEGEKTLLIRLIESKWGALPSDINKRLSEIKTSEGLEALGEKVIGCEKIEDLFKNE
ncbi:transposase [Candidatus Scalindua japonica]|uniref:Transposase n=1 Tax=Candidatus Scalindua japonica TaxID=1284222 RepID=A0A286TZC9_9BACT|nr:DUF4351 domain-containing protein [Candidatus Scalindua japonica]GAX61240.1 transposase [Candidatus Scalindua japonica]